MPIPPHKTMLWFRAGDKVWKWISGVTYVRSEDERWRAQEKKSLCVPSCSTFRMDTSIVSDHASRPTVPQITVDDESRRSQPCHDGTINLSDSSKGVIKTPNHCIHTSKLKLFPHRSVLHFDNPAVYILYMGSSPTKHHDMVV